MAIPAETAKFRFGHFTLDVADRQLLENGTALILRARAFDVLVALVARAGKLVSKDELLELVWRKLVVEENNLQVHIAALRKLVGREAIATVPGRGYRFMLPVEGAGEDRPIAKTELITQAIYAGPASRLPETATELIGRDHDVALLIDRLRRNRLVTVVGPGGIGKTRLALAVGRNAIHEYADGVIWVELAAISDPALVVSHVAAAVGLAAVGGQISMEILLNDLRSRSALLLLDNAEHLPEAVAQLVDSLLCETREIRILVTSQVRLRLSAEQVYRLDALDLPLADSNVTEALHHGAVAFFVARATAADRRFELNEANLGTVLEVCRRLDGIPLALELAAARLPFLGLNALAARLDERFRVLGASSPNAPKRQQALSAVFDWSFRLLTEEEQTVFRRLGLLTAPFTLEQACSVVSDPQLDEWAVVDLVGNLVERSLVNADGGDLPSYRLLDTGRAYALEKLRIAGEETAIERASRIYEQAGSRAAAISNNAEALMYLSTARDLAAMLPPSPIRDACELEICLKLGPAIQTALGPAHRRCEEIYLRAVQLARQTVADERTFKALWGYWHFLCMTGRDRDAAPLADEIVGMARSLCDDGLELEACHGAFTTQQLLGNAPALVANAQRAIALYDCGRHHHLTFSFGGHDPGICALGQGSVGLWLTGLPAQAMVMAKEALRLGSRVTHSYSRAVAFYYTAMAYAACGRMTEFRSSAEGLIALSEEHTMEMLLTEGKFFRGYARYKDDDGDAGVTTMADALAVIEASGDLAFVFFYIALLAEAHLARRELESAKALVTRGIKYSASGQGFFLPELFRLHGEVQMAQGYRASALLEVRQAIDLADEQGAPSLALRAATSLARYEGKPAFDDLMSRLRNFNEGADTYDHQLARHVLAGQ